MNLELYKAFYYTVQYGNISRASEHLFITQPALSKAIRQLEDELKCTLFLRTSRGVKLTQEGEILHQYISQAFNFIQTGENKLKDVRDLLGGEIRIGVSDTLCKHYLLPYLKLFHTLHPAVRIHVVCPTTPGIAEGLKAGAIDFGVINLPYDDSQLQFQSILKVQDLLYRRFSIPAPFPQGAAAYGDRAPPLAAAGAQQQFPRVYRPLLPGKRRLPRPRL